MLFLSPLLLWFLAAAAVPIAIHLINRRRHKTIQWAAMQFLLKASRQSRGKKKLRHILILTCRALAIAALAFAAARPVVSGLIGWGGGSIDTVVLLLDRSASMEIKPGDGLTSRREISIRKIQETVASLGAGRLVLIDSASGKPQEIPDPSILENLSATAATDTEADFPALLGAAAEFLTDVGGRSEIWLASDLQRGNWRPDDERWTTAVASLAAMPQPPVLRVLSITGATAENSSIRLLSCRRSGDELLLELEISRSGDARGTVSLPLTTQLNGGRTTENLTIPGQSLRFQKRLSLSADSDTGHGWLSIPADGNARDNSAFFAYGPPRPAKSIIVSAEGESADYLALAAAPPELGNYETQRIDPAEAVSSITADLAAVIWAAPLPSGAAADALQAFLTTGGHVLFLPPGGDSGDSFNGISWSDPSEADAGKFHILSDWVRDDGPLRDGADGTAVSADRLKAIRRQIPKGESTPLARWEDGEPALIRKTLDAGTLWFLGSIPDYTWSNLGDADVLIPVVQRVIAAGGERFDSSYLTHVGSVESRLIPGEFRSRIDDYGSPDPANTAYEAGIHKLGDRLIAINRPPKEDSAAILQSDSFDAMFAGIRHTHLDQAGQTDSSTISRDVWRAFLVAVLFFLLSEALLCMPKKNTTEALPKKAV